MEEIGKQSVGKTGRRIGRQTRRHREAGCSRDMQTDIQRDRDTGSKGNRKWNRHEDRHSVS